MDLRGLAMIVRASFLGLMLGALTARALAQAQPPEGVYDGALLTMSGPFLILTSGDALRLAQGATFEGIAPAPGTFVRVTLDPKTHDVMRVLVAAHAFGGGRSAATIPREAIAVDARSARTAGNQKSSGSGAIVQVTIVVEVPANTPTGDAVYFSTDRSNFSVAETRMDQLDALHWTLVLPLLEGTALRYKFTRGSYATTERDRAGADVPARALVARKGAHTSDTVLRWADLR